MSVLTNKNHSYKRKKSNNSGFTLVELIVVLVLMTIMLSVTLFGALGWIDWSRFQQENSNAEVIFYAAQNQLTSMDASGSIKRMLSDIRTDDDENYQGEYILAQGTSTGTSEGAVAEITIGDFDGYKNSNGILYDWTTIWLDRNLQKERRTLLKLRADNGDYDRYLQDRDTVGDGTRLLFDLIAGRISDKKVLNGAIALEFSPEAGQVFAVCYSDQVDFDYEEATSESVFNVKDRTLQLREASMVGYYAVDSMTDKIRGRSSAGDDFRLELKNANVFTMILHPKTLRFDAANIEFTISGSQTYAGNYEDKFTIAVANSNVIPEGTIETGMANPVSAVVTWKDGAGLYKGQTKEIPIPMWKDGEGCIHVLLDAADIQAQSVTYAEMFGLLGSDESAVEEAQYSFGRTYSFYRFGLLDTRFIRARVSLTMSTMTGGGEAGRAVDFDDYFEPYSNEGIRGEAITFANWDENEDDDTTYGILNGRHLYNVRFESDYSDLFKTNKLIEDTRSRKFMLKQTIHWKDDFLSGSDGNCFMNSMPDTGAVVFEKGTIGIGLDPLGQNFPEELNIITKDQEGNDVASNPGFDTANYPFPGFRALSYGDKFVSSSDPSTDPVYNKIVGLNISLSANIIYGVYGKNMQSELISTTQSTYENLNVRGKAGLLPLGLFAENYGEISKIALNEVTVKGVEGFPVGNPSDYLYTSRVGGFVGENFGELATLYNGEGDASDRAKISYVRGEFDVGGIVGHQYYMVKKGDESETSEGGTDSGNTNKDSVMTLSGCVNRAKVTGIGYVGGIIGRIYPKGAQNFDVEHKVGDKTWGYSNWRLVEVDPALFELTSIERFVIDACRNYGEISMDPDFARKTIDGNSNRRGYYFGGITGAAFYGYNIANGDSTGFDFASDESKYAVIRDCESVTLYAKSELMKILAPKDGDAAALEEAKRFFRMQFVGGIVGGSWYAYIDNCSTTPEEEEPKGEDSEDKYSFVFGDRYVGGVAGYAIETSFSGTEDYNVKELAKVTSFTEEEIREASGDGFKYRKDYSVINGTGAYGNYAIGGIAGAFGRPEGAGGVSMVKDGLMDGYSTMGMEFPVGCAQTLGNKNRIVGLLNTSLVLGGSYNSKANSGLTGSEESKRSFYGVGGITGVLATTIQNADYIQSEDTKKFNCELISYETGVKLASVSALNNLSIANLKKMINASCFATDGVGGIVGQAQGMGNINIDLPGTNETKEYKSQIDAIVFGRNRVGGAVGDTTASSRGGQSALVDLYPSRIVEKSTGMYVLGYENVGGLVGVFSDNGGENTYPKLSYSTREVKVDNKSVTTYKEIDRGFTVLGYRAVGGAIGTFARDNGSDDWIREKAVINIDPANPGSEKVNVKGEMYVGGAVGILEGYTKKHADITERFFLRLNNVNVTGDCFAGCVAGAILSDSGYWKLDRLAVSSHNDENGKYGEVDSTLRLVKTDAKICAGVVSGLYAYNSSTGFDQSHSVLWNNTSTLGNENYRRYGSSTAYTSQNGLYNISSIDGLKSDLAAKPVDDDYRGLIARIKSVYHDAYPATANEKPMEMDMKKFTDTVQRGGGKANQCYVIADLYVGGLCGFIPEDITSPNNKQTLTVANYRNRSNLEVRRALQTQEIGDSDQNYYSYLGAVTGRIPKGMIVRRCKNTSGQNDEDHYQITGNTSFMGGIAEINAGIVQDVGFVVNNNKEVLDVSNDTGLYFENTHGWLGGIVGLNGTRTTDGVDSGVIYHCSTTFVANGIRGKKVGGIAAAAGGESTISACESHTVLTVNSNTQNDNECGAAGILYEVLAGSSIKLDNNINTCLIQKGTNALNAKTAGIVYNSRGLGEITLCRNYTTNLTYAITSNEQGKRAKTIKYCLDAGNTSEETTDKISGFGGVAGSDDSDMVANLFIGKKSAESGGGSQGPTRVFSAYQYYTINHKKPDNTTWYSPYSDPIRNFEVSGTPTNIDRMILSSTVMDEDVEQNVKSVWNRVDKTTTPNGTLTFDVRASDSSGSSEGMYADIDEFSIVWDNYLKTERELYYSNSSIPTNDASLAADSYFKEFIGNDPEKIYDSWRGIVLDEVKNETHRAEVNTKYGTDYNENHLRNNYDLYWAKFYGLATYVKMVKRDDFNTMTSNEKKELYIKLLYENAAEAGRNENASYYNDIRAYRDNEINCPYFGGYISAIDWAPLDYALDELHFGSNYAKTKTNDQYYLSSGNSENYTRGNNMLNREAIADYALDTNDTKRLRYLYATYRYMLNMDSAIPEDYQERMTLYRQLLIDNEKNFGSINVNNNSAFQLIYCVRITDVDGKDMLLSPVYCNIDNSDNRVGQTIDIEDIDSKTTAESNNYYSGIAESHNGVNRTNHNSVVVYKDSSFNKNKINRIVVIVVLDNNSGNNDGRVGVRGLAWKTAGGESVAMESTESSNPFGNVTGISEMIEALEDNKIALSPLYFEPTSPNSPDLCLYGSSTGINKININPPNVREDSPNWKKLIDGDPVYLSDEYVEDQTAFDAGNYSNNMVLRYNFFKKVDPEYVSMMDVIYSAE